MLREEAKEELLGYLYIDGVLPKIVNRKYVEDLFNKIYDEHEAELEEAMKPKTCDGCEYLHGAICKHDRGLYCVRQFEEDYFQQKEQ